MLHQVKKGLFFIVFFGVIVSPLLAVAASHSEPYVVTGNVTNIDTNRATLNGFAAGNGLSTKAWFQYGRDTNLNSSTSKTSVGSGSDNYSRNISGLRADTVYYFRAVAQNNDGTNYGTTFYFRTGVNYSANNYYYNQPNCQNYYDNYYYPDNYYYSNCYNNSNQYQNYNNSSSPTAITSGASDVGTRSVQLNGTIINNINNPSYAWFEWGTTTNLGNTTPRTYTGSAATVNHINILSGLRPNTVYYFRAVAENSYFRNNGDILSFVTAPGVVIQNEPTYIYQAPATTVEPAPTDSEEVKTPEPETNTSAVGATVLGAGSFFPGNAIGWLVIIILLLLFIMLIKHPSINPWNNHKNDAHH